jgi:hypothetical protein
MSTNRVLVSVPCVCRREKSRPPSLQDLFGSFPGCFLVKTNNVFSICASLKLLSKFCYVNGARNLPLINQFHCCSFLD